MEALLGDEMAMSWKTTMKIEDLRNHSCETVANLQSLLASGATVTPDAKRPGFFEVESESYVYYVCLSEASGKVLLLATWPSERVLESISQCA
jgi:hypothetical protein